MDIEQLRARQAPLKHRYSAMVATLDTDATDEQLVRLGELTERYCVVAHTLNPPPSLTVVRAAG